MIIFRCKFLTSLHNVAKYISQEKCELFLWFAGFYQARVRILILILLMVMIMIMIRVRVRVR